MTSANHQPNTTVWGKLIHREIVQVTLLVVVAVAAFALTRAVATSNRKMSLHDAAEWYQRGQRQLGRGDLDGAVDAFRRATLKNRSERDYVLALAGALASKHLDSEARNVLLALRESSPEDAEINLQLARLSAGRHDVTEAVRYYNNALYSPWSSEQAEARRQVRFELARFLLTHSQSSRALSELLADLRHENGI